MAYITTERVAEIRKELKTTFPDYKFSVTRDDHSGVRIDILEAPVMLLDEDRTYQSVNNYYISEHFKDVETASILTIINNIANQGVKYYETGDYGNQPSHYVYISIGRWNKPFKMIVAGAKGKTIAAWKIKSK